MDENKSKDNNRRFEARAIQSPIDLDDAIKIISPLIEQIGYINEYMLDMKYNPKNIADVSSKIEDLRSKAEYRLNPVKSHRKK